MTQEVAASEELDVSSATESADESFDLGADLETPDVASEDDEEEQPSAETAAPDPTNGSAEREATNEEIDLLRADPATLTPREKAAQTQLRQRQGEMTRAQQQSQTRAEQLQTQLNNLQQQYNALAAGQQQGADATDPIEQLKSSVDEDTAKGLDVVDEVINHRVGGRVDTLEKSNAELTQTVKQLAAMVLKGQVSAGQKELQGAIDAYSKEELQKFAVPIKALRTSVNPVTGKNYSIGEAYEILSGKAASTAANMAAAEQKVTTTTRKRTEQPPAVEAGEDSTESLSANEAIAKLKSLPGFE